MCNFLKQAPKSWLKVYIYIYIFFLSSRSRCFELGRQARLLNDWCGINFNKRFSFLSAPSICRSVEERDRKNGRLGDWRLKTGRPWLGDQGPVYMGATARFVLRFLANTFFMGTRSCVASALWLEKVKNKGKQEENVEKGGGPVARGSRLPLPQSHCAHLALLTLLKVSCDSCKSPDEGKILKFPRFNLPHNNF